MNSAFSISTKLISNDNVPCYIAKVLLGKLAYFEQTYLNTIQIGTEILTTCYQNLRQWAPRFDNLGIDKREFVPFEFSLGKVVQI